MERTDVTVEDLLEDLCGALDHATEAVRPKGDGWYMLTEISKRKGWGLDRTRINLERLVVRGDAEKIKVGATNFYRLIKHA